MTEDQLGGYVKVNGWWMRRCACGAVPIIRKATHDPEGYGRSPTFMVWCDDCANCTERWEGSEFLAVERWNGGEYE